jgi:hypothetical protein
LDSDKDNSNKSSEINCQKQIIRMMKT